MRSKFLGIAFVSVLALSGCATMFASGSEAVTFNSEPNGARVTTQNGQTLGTTPFTTQLDPSRTYLLTFSKEGYQNTAFSLNRKVDGVAFLNLLCVLCWGIDFATGAVWGLDTHAVNVTMSRETASMGVTERYALACRNYAALASTQAGGRITADIRGAGDEVVQAATGVSREECASAEPVTSGG